MINFRFHLVSLVAVFLALAVGIVMGSTVIDRAIVDGLRSQINRVEHKAEVQRTQNHELSAEVGRLEEYERDVAPYTVQGRLTGVPVVVVAEHGVDSGTVKSAVMLLQQAGADAPVILWLEPAWTLAQDRDRTRLESILGAMGDRAALRQLALRRLSARLAGTARPAASAGTATTSSTSTSSSPPTTTTPARDVLSALVDGGFVSVEQVGGSGAIPSRFPAAGARALVLTGPDSDVAVRGLVGSVAGSLDAAGIGTVAGEVDPSGGDASRGTSLAPIRDDSSLSRTVSTVDDLDLVEGRVAAVLALEGLAQAKVGHYGYGSGATRGLPTFAR